MEKKQYQTVGRAALIRYLKRVCEAPPQTADEIYAGLSVEGDAPGKSSVYRILSALAASGEVRRSRSDAEHGGFVYQYVGAAGGCDGHLHLQCLVCGRISHLKCHCSTEISIKLLQDHGFRVDHGRSVLYGTCAACAAHAKGGQT
ncbi:MAG: transcriptional repressor [Ruminococcaceae bacterium]|nr:transcriptional repressor [Oscillospiraceae bacterium]